MQRSSRPAERSAPRLLGKHAALAVAMMLVVVVGVALASPTAQGAARFAIRLAAAAKSLHRRAPSAPAVLLNGRVFGGTPAVGALFTMSGGHLGAHECTASVVASPAGNLVITAAHCVNSTGQYGFAPGYHNGTAPYGIWTVSKVFVARAWAVSADPNYDVAFVVVQQAGRGQNIQQVTGANRVGTGWAQVQAVQVIGYPTVSDSPITCRANTRAFGGQQLQFDCGGYTDGTSGGPFLAQVSRATGLGTVIGVIGGYQQGGSTPSVSYSSRFGRAVAALYQRAAAGS
jgi:V8-like Glu-specific endopeptidase